MHTSLDIDTITQLLKGETATASSNRYPPPIQIGPLTIYEAHNKHCSSRGCTGATNLAINGAPYCSMHALQEMNRMLLQEDISDCGCQSGKYTKGHMHSAGCPVYARVKEQGVNNRDTTESVPGQL